MHANIEYVALKHNTEREQGCDYKVYFHKYLERKKE